jgi:hypothetical protein
VVTARRVAVVDGRRLSVLLAHEPGEDPPSELVLRRRGAAEELRFGVDGDEALIDAEDVPEGAWDAHAAGEPVAAARAGGVVVLASLRVRPRSEDGRLVIDASPLPPYAELLDVRVEADALVLRTDPPGEVVARQRAEAREVAAAGGRLAFADLADGVWDLYAGDLRVGRHRDGLPGKRDVVVFPARRAGASEARPYYTVEDNLSVRVGPPAEHEAADGDRELAEPRSRGPLKRLVLAPLAIAAHRAATALLRRVLHLGARGGGDGGVRILLMHAWGLGGTIRTTFNVAGYLAGRHDVEIVSVMRGRERPFFAFPPGVRVRALDDRRGRPGGLLRRLPSVLVHPDDHVYALCSLRTDLELARWFRATRSGVIVTTRAEIGRAHV